MNTATIEGSRTPTAYSAYSKGRDRTRRGLRAKADYMAAKRAAARDARDAANAAGRPYIVEGIKHGYSGYVNHLCQCGACKDAKAVFDARRRAG
ncbi:hypothetical protein [Salinispora vitiensis]|uniref:hypothetical protein n=1 Tax=Salinispora vitiensis TaxID=999544 RepID=UPI0003617829|nr:hypothetical protein [Salinispora vitiensis]